MPTFRLVSVMIFFGVDLVKPILSVICNLN